MQKLNNSLSFKATFCRNSLQAINLQIVSIEGSVSVCIKLFPDPHEVDGVHVLYHISGVGIDVALLLNFRSHTR